MSNGHGPKPFMQGFKVSRIKQKPQLPVDLNTAVDIIKRLTLAGREARVQLNIFSDEEIEVILLALPLTSSDIIE